MGSRRKSWLEKLADKKGLPKILTLKRNFPCYNAVHRMGAQVGDKVVLVNPSEVVEIMKEIPKGRLTTIVEICKKIARQHDVEACCSLTTGIFIMTAANAVEEHIGKARCWTYHIGEHSEQTVFLIRNILVDKKRIRNC